MVCCMERTMALSSAISASSARAAGAAVKMASAGKARKWDKCFMTTGWAAFTGDGYEAGSDRFCAGASRRTRNPTNDSGVLY